MHDQASSTLLYSFAEHVQFRNDGWHEEAIKRAALCILHERTAGLPDEVLISQTLKLLDLSVDSHIAAEVIGTIVDSNEAYKQGTLIFLSQSERTRLDQVQLEAERIEGLCEARFNEQTRKHHVYKSITWAAFIESLIVPLTEELGSRTLDLLRGQSPVSDTKAARQFLEAQVETERELIKQVVADYLDPRVEHVRLHLLGYLTNYTLIAAGGLTSIQVESLLKTTGPIEIDVLIDTNVAFSMLGLHRNPLNDATASLLSLQKHLGNGVRLRFHMLSTTVNEAKSALTMARNEARKIHANSAFKRAAIDAGVLSGLVEAYLSNDSISRVSPDTYFDVYINGLEAILAERNILVLDATVSASDPVVSQRVTNWLSFSSDGHKSRQLLEHDVTVIETVRQKRPANSPTAASAGWWFVTLDLRLQGKERKDIAGSASLPTILNPAELIQLVRLWMPRTLEMERALVGALRMPFTFYSYDRALEASVMQILAVVNNVAGIDGISEDAALRVLRDATLQSRIAGTLNEDPRETTKAVAEALVRVDMVYEPRAIKAEAMLREQHEQATPSPQVTKITESRSRASTTSAIKDRDKWKATAASYKLELEASRSPVTKIDLATTASKSQESIILRLAKRTAERRITGVRIGAGLMTLAAFGSAVWLTYGTGAEFSEVEPIVGYLVGAPGALVTAFTLFPRAKDSIQNRYANRLERSMRKKLT
ncbi:hypothetical protein BFL34_01936 [Clavibacter michiganensis]|uniref:Uncharacterized protein n=2 Tax=Clavibacter michiganensis TaxID=28447 RepID=A0A251Y689_9MICO|nr:hypothetical protein BFL34_01936 [Clavibacter michiganensis]